MVWWPLPLLGVLSASLQRLLLAPLPQTVASFLVLPPSSLGASCSPSLLNTQFVAQIRTSHLFALSLLMGMI